MVSQPRKLREGDEGMIGVHIILPAEWRRLYRDHPELRGKLSEHCRLAIGSRLEMNGFGLEHARQALREAQEAKLAADAKFESANMTWKRALQDSLQKHTQEADVETSREMLAQILEQLTRQYQAWHGRQPQKDARKLRRTALTWCQARLDEDEVLKVEFGTPEGLLGVLEAA